jgi:hypothetical protein
MNENKSLYRLRNFYVKNGPRFDEWKLRRACPEQVERASGLHF